MSTTWKFFILIGFLCLLMFCQDARAEKVQLIFNNCVPGTWVGVVKWVDGKTDYVAVPDSELRGQGVKKILVEPGLYAITHFSPPRMGVLPDGRMVMMPSKILDYRDIEIKRSGFWRSHAWPALNHRP